MSDETIKILKMLEGGFRRRFHCGPHSRRITAEAMSEINGRKLLLCTLIAGLFSVNLSAGNIAMNNKMNEYENLWWQFDLAGARKVLDEILAVDPVDPDANRKMAFIEYYYLRDFDAALGSIQRSITGQPEKADNHAMQGDIHAAWGRSADALESYRASLAIDSTDADVHYSMGMAHLKMGDRAGAKASWEKSIQLDRYHLDANRALHQFYAGDGEYEKAYRIWKTGNLIVAGRKPIGNTGRWNDRYQAALADSSANFHQTMGDAYAEMLLYDEAGIEYGKALVLDAGSGELRRKSGEVALFIHFKDALKQILVDYYRRRILGGKKVENAIIDTLMPVYAGMAVLFPGMKKPQKADEDWFYLLNEEIEKRFKVNISYGYANGFFNCHFGYIIGDTMAPVVQWGMTGNLRFVTLKNMENNGFSAWYWNYLGQDGGWTSSGENVQVNKVTIVMDPKYGAVVRRWRDATDKKRRDAIIDNCEKTDSAFIEKPPSDVFYSTLLDRKFMFKAVDEAVKRAQTLSLSRDETEAYVMNLLFDHYYTTTTVIHEGQHALDGMHGKYQQWELEYRAKLSEIVFGEMPFLSLSDLMSQDIGNMKLPHGKANTKVFKDIVEYIFKNKAKYPAIDTKKSILMQLGDIESATIKSIAREIFLTNYK